MTPKFSIIIPVYNVEKYLEECLRSVLSQSFGNIEVICVEDGSTDSSARILERIAVEDKRIIKLSQKNKGPGEARNTGILNAKGEYIVFLDSDDMLREGALQEIAAKLDENNLDCLIFSTEVFIDASDSKISEKENEAIDARAQSESNYYNLPSCEELTTPQTGAGLMVNMFNVSHFVVSPPLRAIKRSVLLDNKILFPPAIIHEDCAFTVAATVMCNRAMYTADKYYLRRVRPGSIMTQVDSSLKHKVGYICAFMHLAKLIEKFDCFSTEYKAIETYLRRTIVPAVCVSNNDLLPEELYELARVARNLVPPEIKSITGALTSSTITPMIMRLKKLNASSNSLSKKLKSAESEITELKNSFAYRVGMFATWPARKAFKMVKNLKAKLKNKPARDIRVLFLCGGGWGAKNNPFAGTLGRGLKKAGAKISFGGIKILESSAFDIVHIMWPEELYGWKEENAALEDCERIKSILEAAKNKGAKIVYTRHNARLHVFENAAVLEYYKMVEQIADAVLHMGEYSKKEFLEANPQTKSLQFVIPHHTYGHMARIYSRNEARAWLGLDADSPTVLAFGAFRSDAERDFFAKVIERADTPGLKALAPRFGGEKKHSNIITLDENESVPPKYLPLYFSAADVVFIQRLSILNSGNLPMAYHFGKVCVGPDCGDVGEILKASGNFVFEPGNVDSASVALKSSLKADPNIGRKNRILADSEWDENIVAAKVLSVYKDLLREAK